MTTDFYWRVCDVCSCDVTEIGGAPLPELVCQLLAQRGIVTQERAESFLNPRLQHLSDPFELKDMRKAVDRVFEAIDREEEICIYGDYDVDGIISVTLLLAVLSHYDATPRAFIPIRSREGYGLSAAGIARCLEEGALPKLLIAVDCGTSSVEEIASLKEQGIDVVVLDHHEAGAHGIPDAVAVVNAKLDDSSSLDYLCSAGVVFKLAHALLKERRLPDFDLKHYLDLVAMATIADIVPLVDENRILVRHGLKRLGQSTCLGLNILNEQVGMRSAPNAAHVSFRLGPRINAAGRMDSPMDALELLTTLCDKRAATLSDQLNKHNRARQEVEENTRNEALAMLEQHFDTHHDPVIVLASAQWHPGVVGIVASQLMRRYHKPTFVISLDEHGCGKGSGRSIPGVSLVKAIQACSEYLISGGGHEMAAGLVIEGSKIDAFREAFGKYVEMNSTEEERHPVLRIDAEVNFAELNLDLLDSYELLEPFGNANPQPIFLSRNVILTDAPKRVSGNHLKLYMKQGNVERDAIFFNGAEFELPDPPWDIAFTIDRNVWRGRHSLSISIQQIKASSIANS